MKKLLLSSLLITLVLSCDKKVESTIVDTKSDTIMIPETNEPIVSSTLQTCYMAAVKNDSVFISLEDNLGTLTGKMRYKNFEKDSSYGTLVGFKNADTLKLMYTFESEGTTSEREIYFVLKGDKLLEATGPYTSDNGSKSVYTDPSKLQYNGHELTQVDCTPFEKNFIMK